MPLHITYPLINGIYCARKCPFPYTNFQQQKSPYRGRGVPPPKPSSRLVASLLRFDPPPPPHWQILAAPLALAYLRGKRAHAPPIIGVKEFLKGGVGDWYMPRFATSHNLHVPPNNGMCKKMPFSYTNFQKISLPWEGDTPSHTLHPLSRFAPSFCPPPPLLKNPGYASGARVYMCVLLFVIWMW